MFYFSLESVMVVFALLHFILSAIFFVKLYGFMKSGDYKTYIDDPLTNSGILAPFISAVMSMNVIIGPVRFLIPSLAVNLQNLMLPAFIVWTVIFFLLLRIEIKLLKNAFVKSFDINRISFGWLLHPLALGMLTVTGTGFAALATSAPLAHTAAFMSMVSGSMGIFLLLIKLVSVFQKHFASQDGLGAKQLMPSYLVVVPNITLYAISAFRIGHYLEKHHAMHLDWYFLLVITLAFAFETWYLLFGFSLLKDYFKNHHFKREFFMTQWGFICPLVAFAVLGSFAYEVFVKSPVLIAVIIFFLAASIIFYIDLFIRHLKCGRILKGEIACDG